MLVEVQRSGLPVVVDGVADELVLQLAEEAEVKAREADRSRLRIATHWAERHQVEDVFKAAHWRDADVRDVARRRRPRLYLHLDAIMLPDQTTKAARQPAGFRRAARAVDRVDDPGLAGDQPVHPAART